MKIKYKKIVTILILCFSANLYSQIDSSTFEDIFLPVNSVIDNSISGGFYSGNNYYPPSDWNANLNYYASWWAASNMADSVTSGYTNQYSAKTAKGVNESTNYIVGYGNPKVHFVGSNFRDTVLGFYVTNTTFTYNDIRDGSNFSKKFGGTSGNDPDWFKLTVKKWYKDTLRSDSVIFYLADFRFANNANDYILKNWQWINCKSLGLADSLQFFLSSSDTIGGFGMNTPAYFAMDNLKTKATMVGINSTTENNNKFLLFPNPATDFLSLKLPENLLGEKITLKIFDITGKNLLNEQIITHQNFLLNISLFDKGNYLLQLITKTESKTLKFIKN